MLVLVCIYFYFYGFNGMLTQKKLKFRLPERKGPSNQGIFLTNGKNKVVMGHHLR